MFQHGDRVLRIGGVCEQDLAEFPPNRLDYLSVAQCDRFFDSLANDFLVQLFGSGILKIKGKY